AGLEIEFDLQTKAVVVSWPINLDLFFLKLERITIEKAPKPSDKVKVKLVGTFIGNQEIPDWDATEEDPPEVPGGGKSAFDLRLLAIGQRVTIPGLASINTVADAVAALKKFAQPAPDSDKVPVGTDPASCNPIYSAHN